MSKYLIVVVGPTAIGKTSLGIALANYFNSEIISADSRQFYKEMNIGTAVPTLAELQAAKHHFVHHISISEKYSVGHFESDAISKLNYLFNSYNIAIMVGGSALYVDAVINGLDKFPKIDSAIREELNQKLHSEGLDSLTSQLEKYDIYTYNKIDLKNPHRVIRALEVCLSTGKPYSSFLKKNDVERNFKTIKIGLRAEREIIYQRINERVDKMMEVGLLNEVRSLVEHKSFNALNTVGYKELFNFIEGKWELDFAISEIKKNTRRFAKRQLTWFNKDEDIRWFDYMSPTSKIISYIESQLH